MSGHNHDIPGSDLHYSDRDGDSTNWQTVYDENNQKVDGVHYNPDNDRLWGADRDNGRDKP